MPKYHAYFTETTLFELEIEAADLDDAYEKIYDTPTSDMKYCETDWTVLEVEVL